eukprot:scaffold198664_cov17-Tisochrysis_lutea.AAC.3
MQLLLHQYCAFFTGIIFYCLHTWAARASAAAARSPADWTCLSAASSSLIKRALSAASRPCSIRNADASASSCVTRAGMNADVE